jgi:hypothetical protein
MSDIETSNQRPITPSQTAYVRSKEPSRESSLDRDEEKSKSLKLKSILKRRKNPEPRSRSSSVSSIESMDSGSSYATANESAEEGEGIEPIIRNLYHGTHVALSNKGDDAKRSADKLIKRGASKDLSEAIKRERIKGAQMFVDILGDIKNFETKEVPVFKPFNKKKPACSQDVFDKHLLSIIRHFPKFGGKSAEFLYFLIELDAIRNSNNLTDDQLLRILKNRFCGRLHSYFLVEMRRERNVVNVLNRISQDYIDVVDPEVEMDKYINFKLKFQDTASELVQLKEVMSFAYPNMPRDVFRQAFIQKVIGLIPKEGRYVLIEEFERQRALEKKGFAPLTDYEIDAKIIKHCQKYEKRQPRSDIAKVTVGSNCDSANCSESEASNDNSDEDAPVDNHNYIKGLGHSVSLALQDTSHQSEGVEDYQANSPENNDFILVGPSDQNYYNIVSEVKEAHQIRYFGEKIRLDIRNASDHLHQVLNEVRASRPQGYPVYEWIGERYKIDDCPVITGPVFKKVGNQVPLLTWEILIRFASCCYACGFSFCPGKGKREESFEKCAYHDKFDSWSPCRKCMRGFHSSRDCLADL